MSDKATSIIGQFMRRRQRLAAQQREVSKVTIEYAADGSVAAIYTTPVAPQPIEPLAPQVPKRKGRPPKLQKT